MACFKFTNHKLIILCVAPAAQHILSKGPNANTHTHWPILHPQIISFRRTKYRVAYVKENSLAFKEVKD